MTRGVARLFVVGVGRSGTSLLQSMLASHNSIVMLPETSFVRRYLLSARFRQIDEIEADMLKSDKYLSRWDKAGISCVRDLHETTISLRKLYDEVSNQYANAFTNPVSYIAEKDPKLIEGLIRMDAVFANYRVVHIYRDPRDVVLSKNKAEWSKKQSLFKKLVANNAQIELLEIFARGHRQILYEVKYEDLLAEPESTLRGICSFLDIPYQDSMLDYQEQARKLVSKDEMSWKKETLGPLLNGNMNKWRQDMGPLTACQVEKSCCAVMAKGGYDETCSGLSSMERLRVKIFSLLVRLTSATYVLKSRYFHS